MRNQKKVKIIDQKTRRKKFLLATLLLIWLLLPQAKAWAATYYVDIDGVGEDGILGTADDVISSDTNPGTEAQPWKTLGKTKSTVVGGDTVIVRNGSYGAYSEAYVDRTDWVTYRVAEGHNPQITNILVDNQGRVYDTYLIFDGFTIGPRTGRSIVEVRNSRYTQFLNLNIIGNGAKDTSYGFRCWGSSSDIIIDNSTFSGGDKTGRFDGFNTGIDASGCNNLIITNNEIRQFHYMGVSVPSKNIIIRNNNIHYSGADAGIAIGEGEGPLLIENNRVYDLYLYQPILTETPTATTWSADGTIMTNPSAMWEVNEPIVWAGAYPNNNMEIWIISGTNVKTGDNDVRLASVDSPTQITLQKSIKNDPNGATPSDVDYILIDKTHGDLLQVYAYGVTENVTIRNNQFYDAEGQFWWVNPYNANEPNNRGGHNFLIENNLFWNSYTSGQDEYNHNAGTYNIEGLVFRNNVVIGRLEMNSCGNVKFHNNIIGYIAAGSTVGWIENDYNILNRGWIAAPYSVGPHDRFFYPNSYSWNKWNDPNFTSIFADYANGDFRHASATSLGVGHGDPTNSPSTDILGNIRDSQPDAGCYEYGASTFLYGDVSGDGSITTYDAALAAQAAVGLITLTADQIKAADVSGDGQVSAYDAALIAQRAVGLIERFPVEG